MWLENLKELKKVKGMTTKQIAEATKIPEGTIKRIFSGDTPNPLASTLHSIVTALGGSLDDILADSKLVVGNKDLVALQEKVDSLNAENERLQMKIAELTTQLADLNTLTNVLKTELFYKNEIIKIHNYYNKIKESD